MELLDRSHPAKLLVLRLEGRLLRVERPELVLLRGAGGAGVVSLALGVAKAIGALSFGDTSGGRGCWVDGGSRLVAFGDVGETVASETADQGTQSGSRSGEDGEGNFDIGPLEQLEVQPVLFVSSRVLKLGEDDDFGNGGHACAGIDIYVSIHL